MRRLIEILFPDDETPINYKTVIAQTIIFIVMFLITAVLYNNGIIQFG